jgi:hypothetical protein
MKRHSIPVHISSLALALASVLIIAVSPQKSHAVVTTAAVGACVNSGGGACAIFLPYTGVTIIAGAGAVAVLTAATKYVVDNSDPKASYWDYFGGLVLSERLPGEARIEIDEDLQSRVSSGELQPREAELIKAEIEGIGSRQWQAPESISQLARRTGISLQTSSELTLIMAALKMDIALQLGISLQSAIYFFELIGATEGR